jgi:hypothetical protein
MRYNRQKWQARAVVPSALQDLQGFEVDGTWNVPTNAPWKAVSDESHLSMIGARNARVTSTLSGHSPLVRALHLFVHSICSCTPCPKFFCQMPVPAAFLETRVGGGNVNSILNQQSATF